MTYLKENNLQIEKWEEFEKKSNFSIRQMASDYLAAMDNTPQGSWHASTPTLQGFEAFLSDILPNYWNDSSDLVFGIGPFCRHYGIVVFPVKEFKALRGEIYKYSHSHELVMETIDHLTYKAEQMRSLGRVVVMHDIDSLLRKYVDRDMGVYDLPAIPVANAADVEDAVKESLRKMVNAHPTIAARLFNEAYREAGFSAHTKRDEVMDLIAKFLA